MRNEREAIADDLAASQLGAPRRLALALSELEKIQFGAHHLAQAANGGDLMSRIKRLVHPETQATNWKAIIPVVSLATLTLAACTSVASPPADALVAAPTVNAYADFKSCVKPMYPAESLRKQETGTVRMQFDISAEGKVLDSKVVKSSGSIPLDEAAHNAIKLCRFVPAVQDGKPVRALMHMQYIWTLTEPKFVPKEKSTS